MVRKCSIRLAEELFDLAAHRSQELWHEQAARSVSRVQNDLRSEIGAFLDPIADKALLISVFITLGAAGYIEIWLIILVVFRDGLIVAGASVYQILYQNLTMHPLTISKVNTTFQFFLVMVVMGAAGFSVAAQPAIQIAAYAVAVTSIWSGTTYVIIWSRRAAAMEPGE